MKNSDSCGEIDENDWTFRYDEVSELNSTEGQRMTDTDEYSFYEMTEGDIICRFKDLQDQRGEYATARLNRQQRCTEISYLPEARPYFSEFSNSFFHSCWEKVMELHGRFIFHSAFVQTSVGGVLFSGPSGIGKSTQASLWERYDHAELVNGDRTILYSDEGGIWIGAGSPYAGSSKCYKNMKCEVKAVVMLRQSPTCSLRRLSLAESFSQVFRQCTVYSWDPEFTETVCDLVECLCSDIPVYEFACNISEEAVSILRKELGGE